MADTQRTATDPKGQLFDELDATLAGMLGLPGSGQHHQPMTHRLDREASALVFITSRDTDLSRAIGQGREADYVLVGRNHDLHASLRGDIRPDADPARLDEFWTKADAAWFEDGQRDPDVMLLRMDLADAAVWTSTGSTIRYGLEMLRARLSREHKPDLGEMAVVDFRRAA